MPVKSKIAWEQIVAIEPQPQHLADEAVAFRKAFRG
jgi:hypothetical protein